MTTPRLGTGGHLRIVAKDRQVFCGGDQTGCGGGFLEAAHFAPFFSEGLSTLPACPPHPSAMPASAPYNVPVQGWTGSDCFRGSERPDEKEQLKKGLLCLWVTLGTSRSFECSEETAGSLSFCGGSRLLLGGGTRQPRALTT